MSLQVFSQERLMQVILAPQISESHLSYRKT